MFESAFQFLLFSFLFFFSSIPSLSLFLCHLWSLTASTSARLVGKGSCSIVPSAILLFLLFFYPESC